jgi:hypothetical protein
MLIDTVTFVSPTYKYKLMIYSCLQVVLWAEMSQWPAESWTAEIKFPSEADIFH